MRKLLVVLSLALAACASGDRATPDLSRQRARAQDVTIIRDDWGIAHVYGKTDADAVFGMIYAQAEDDFNRIEVNYLNSMGRLAEAEGEGEIWRDLRMRLFIDPEDMQAKYAASPGWLRDLMDAWADGLNYYLATHPDVHPRVLGRFEPWMALTFSEGSIGGDIERVSLRELEAFYGSRGEASTASSDPGDAPERASPSDAEAALDASLALAGESWRDEPSGSNGFAIAPSNTRDGHALLLINPHTSFFFRSELQMVSEEGLNAYGAVTWGQFFVYQGFNDKAGWMHTSSSVDNIDEFLETVTPADGGYTYRHGEEELPLEQRDVTIRWRTDAGDLAERTFTVYRSMHGPIVREQDGKWVATSLMENPVDALTQSYVRTKAIDYDSFRQSMELHTNSSNNTVFADASGDIAYFHSNFIPKRDTSFDWTKPVDGSDPRTDWGEPLSIDATPGALNPPNGWIQNTNNAPWSVTGSNSPKKADYPAYVESGSENPRGIHAIRVLEGKKDFTLQSLIDAAFDPYLTAFEPLVPALVRAYDATPPSDPHRAELSEQVDALRSWDLRWSAESVPTALAVFWGTELMGRVAEDARRANVSIYDWMANRTPPAQMLDALKAASDQLAADFGDWRTPWGEINRFQRLTGDIVQPFDDAKPSIPVPFTSSRWGSLASFGARPYPGTRRWYGTSGNSFVAVVEFGDSVRARAITAGGESGDPASPHFNDEAERYASGDLRPVYYYRSQLEGHTERTYQPGG